MFTDIDGMKGMDAVDALLQILFQYRKKEDLLSDEEECVRNLFNAMVNNTVIVYIISAIFLHDVLLIELTFYIFYFNFSASFFASKKFKTDFLNWKDLN